MSTAAGKDVSSSCWSRWRDASNHRCRGTLEIDARPLMVSFFSSGLSSPSFAWKRLLLLLSLLLGPVKLIAREADVLRRGRVCVLRRGGSGENLSAIGPLFLCFVSSVCALQPRRVGSSASIFCPGGSVRRKRFALLALRTSFSLSLSPWPLPFSPVGPSARVVLSTSCIGTCLCLWVHARAWGVEPNRRLCGEGDSGGIHQGHVEGRCL